MPEPGSSSGEHPGGTPSLRPDASVPVPLGELAHRIGASTSAADTAVTGITLDSRQVRPGDLFAAVAGEHAHRADFVWAAAAAGAVAVLTDARGRARASLSGLPVLVTLDPRAHLGTLAATIYGHPGDRLLTFGVTGTNGKTISTYLLAAGLHAAGRSTGLVGTIETRIGDRVVPSERTTPEATDLHALLAVMVESGVTAVAMEVSSHALALGRSDGIVFDVAVFTNLGSDHLDFHGDVETYFRTKAALFTPEHSRAGVVNVDDPYGRRLVDAVATVPITTVSAAGDPAADWRADDVRVGLDGATFTVVGPGSVTARVSLALPGRFNVDNALGAVVALVTAGLPLPRAVEGVAACTGVPGRMERVDAGQDFLALVDYAHTPEALETLLVAVRPLTSGRVLLVFGCGGDRDQAKRPVMGEVAARGADVVVVTDDNPRSEDPGAIRAAVLSGARGAGGAEGASAETVGTARGVPARRSAEVLEQADRAAAIATAVDRAAAGDVVVVAGKGHETFQQVGPDALGFDDRAVLRSALASHRTASHRTASGQTASGQTASHRTTLRCSS